MRILIADDSDQVRSGIRALLDNEADLQVSGSRDSIVQNRRVASVRATGRKLVKLLQVPEFDCE
jgi:DNA-binding NarL/FixJ family response regulator